MSDCTVKLIIPVDVPPVILRIGEQGPAGSSQGAYAIENATGSIPASQIYTVALPSGDISLTLPLIVDVAPGSATNVFTVKNASEFAVTILPAESDEIEFGPEWILPGVPSGRPGNSINFLPTSLGWLIV